MMHGCGAAAPNVIIGTGAASLAGFNAPTNEISQVYYLGIFDPQEQLPPQFYRLTVRGQASFWSNVRFATGWVPSEVVDALNNRISLNANDPNQEPLQPLAPGRKEAASLETGRRLVLFGPEGFREAPRNQRLVVVMGSSPHKFFDAIGQVLSAASSSRKTISDNELNTQILQAIGGAQAEQSNLQLLAAEINRDLTLPLPLATTRPTSQPASPVTRPVTINVNNGTTNISGGNPTISGGETAVSGGTTTITGGRTTVAATQPAASTQPAVQVIGGNNTISVAATQPTTTPAVAINGGSNAVSPSSPGSTQPTTDGSDSIHNTPKSQPATAPESQATTPGSGPNSTRNGHGGDAPTSKPSNNSGGDAPPPPPGPQGKGSSGPTTSNAQGTSGAK